MEVIAHQDSDGKDLSSHSDDVVGELKIVSPENCPDVVCNGRQVKMWLVLPFIHRRGFIDLSVRSLLRNLTPESSLGFFSPSITQKGTSEQAMEAGD